MQPWVGKGTGSSSKTSTLHYDKTLSHLQQQQQQQQQHNTHGQPQSFRTAHTSSSSSSAYQQQPEEQIYNQPNMISEFASYSHTPFNQQTAAHIDMADGTEILEFLNTTNYSDRVHGDDLKPDSISYISYRHQLDTQHALSEKERLQQHWTAELFSAEDIVEYLLQENYTEDIYGIPVLGQYIKEAKEELQDNTQHKRIAVERLTMIKNHLIQKHNNNVDSAARQVFEMNENDWSAFF